MQLSVSLSTLSCGITPQAANVALKPLHYASEVNHDKSNLFITICMVRRGYRTRVPVPYATETWLPYISCRVRCVTDTRGGVFHGGLIGVRQQLSWPQGGEGVRDAGYEEVRWLIKMQKCISWDIHEAGGICLPVRLSENGEGSQLHMSRRQCCREGLLF